MKKLVLYSLAASLMQLAVSQPVHAAEKFETSVVKDKETVSLDPAKTYLLVEAPGAIALTFFKIPTEEERAKDLTERAEALIKAHAKWVKNHKRWEDDVKRYKPGPNQVKLGPEPVEPTETNFTWPALELGKMVTLGPLNRFSKSDEVSLYLQQVPPGEYAYYGSLNLGLGVCVCMGTVKFEALPGKISTLRYDFAFMDKNGRHLDPAHQMPEGEDPADASVRMAMMLGQANPQARDPRLPEDMFQPAVFTAMPTLPNWYGAEINRLQPIPGVLAYERDKVIDLKAEAKQVP